MRWFNLLTGTRCILALPFAAQFLLPVPGAEIKIRDNAPLVLGTIFLSLFNLSSVISFNEVIATHIVMYLSKSAKPSNKIFFLSLWNDCNDSQLHEASRGSCSCLF